MKVFALLAVLVSLGNPALAATEWELDKEHSEVTFIGRQAGEPFRGKLLSYDAKILFDPEDLWGSEIEVTFKAGAVKVEGEERQDAIAGEEWLDAARYPLAVFRAEDIDKDGAGYVAHGTLTLRDITKDVKVFFSLTPRGDDMLAEGYATLNRRDFFVGTGEFASDRWVAFPVDIKFSWVVRPKKASATPEGTADTPTSN